MIPLSTTLSRAGEVRVEADAELDERRQAAVDPDLPAVDAVDAGEALQQRALAAAVAPGDPEELAGADVEARCRCSARRLSFGCVRERCSARSLSVCVRSSGTRKVLLTESTTIGGAARTSVDIGCKGTVGNPRPWAGGAPRERLPTAAPLACLTRDGRSHPQLIVVASA